MNQVRSRLKAQKHINIRSEGKIYGNLALLRVVTAALAKRVSTLEEVLATVLGNLPQREAKPDASADTPEKP